MTDPQELSRRLRQRGKEIRTLNIGVGSALAEANVTLLNEAASLIDAHAARIAELEKALDESRGHAQHWYGEIETIGVLLGIGAPDAGEVPTAVRSNIDLKDTLIIDLQAALSDIALHQPERTDFSGPSEAWDYCRATARKALSNE